MYILVVKVNNSVMYTWNLLRGLIFIVLTIRAKKWKRCEVMGKLIKLIVVITSKLYIIKIPCGTPKNYGIEPKYVHFLLIIYTSINRGEGESKSSLK